MKGFNVDKKGYLIFEHQFFMTPIGLFDDENSLTAYEMLVFTYLMRCSTGGKFPFPSLATISRKCKISLSTVQRALIGLEEKHFITKLNRQDVKQNLSNMYRFGGQ